MAHFTNRAIIYLKIEANLDRAGDELDTPEMLAEFFCRVLRNSNIMLPTDELVIISTMIKK